MVTTIRDNTKLLEKVMKQLVKTDVLVGVPAEGAGRPDGPLNNATIGYLNETGVPERNLPARPHLVPGIEAVQDKIVAHLKVAATAALIGDTAALEQEQHKIGIIAQASVQSLIAEGLSPALSERTVYARLHRKKNRRSPGPMMPLVDTGGYRNSIRYVIRARQHGDGHG